MLLKFGGRLTQFGDLDGLTADIREAATTLLNYNEFLLCFDDLDRKGKDLALDEIFGFVNNLVENEGAKVLILVNETELNSDKSYHEKLKEKVVGVTIQFQQNTVDVCRRMLESRFKNANPVYYNYLLRHIDKRIAPVVSINDSNLRNLTFFFSTFADIYYNLRNALDTDEAFSKRSEEKLDAVLNFSISAAFEYKMGLLNPSNLRLLKDVGVFVLTGDQQALKDQQEYTNNLTRKYFQGHKYYFFESIADYVTGIGSFSIDKLKSELSKLFPTEVKSIQPQDKLLEDLGYWHCLNYTDDQYEALSKQMLEYAIQGKYLLNQYPTVFHYLTRFDNILKFDLDDLKACLKKGIDVERSAKELDTLIHMRLIIDSATEFRDDLATIIDMCKTRNEAIRTSIEKNSYDELKSLLNTDVIQFLKAVSNSSSVIYDKPFWSLLTQQELEGIVQTASNEGIIELAFYFEERYRKEIFEDLLVEKAFVENLILLISDSPSSSNKLKSVALNWLKKKMEAALSNFPK